MVLTPEGIAFPLLLADPVTRFLALFVDVVCIVALSSATGQMLRVLGRFAPDMTAAVLAITYFLINQLYRILCEWFWQGRTLGKRMFRLQVMDAQGLRLRFSQVVLRNVLRVVDQLPAAYLVGGVLCLASARAQRVGDLLANTIVVYHPPVREPDVDRVAPRAYNTFRDYPHLAARLRQSLSPAAAALALEALARRDGLDDDARLRLFAAIRAWLAQRVPFPDEAVAGLSDERYVANVVDILYRA